MACHRDYRPTKTYRESSISYFYPVANLQALYYSPRKTKLPVYVIKLLFYKDFHGANVGFCFAGTITHIAIES